MAADAPFMLEASQFGSCRLALALSGYFAGDDAAEVQIALFRSIKRSLKRKRRSDSQSCSVHRIARQLV